MANANWHDYKIPTAKDVPADLACVPVSGVYCGLDSEGRSWLI
jgi:molybdopterin-guanine dinucleotide biosynthesis protein A